MHRLSIGGEIVVGSPPEGEPFPDRSFLAATAVLWPPAGPGRYAAAVRRVLRRLRPSRIEVHNRPEIALRLRRAFPRTPLALFLHNDPQGMRGARTSAQRRRLLARMQVACVSETLRQRFRDGLPAGAAVALLPNCIDLSQMPAAPRARDPVILFVGRIVADKGADAFVAACASVLPQLAGWRAEMIGADRFVPGSAETPFLAALRPAAAAAGIRLHGYLPHEAVLRAMAGASIVVVPSRWSEPFGMTALEALASGAPLIVSPRPGLLEVVGDAALLAEPDALASAMLRLAGDAALRSSLSERARLRAARFDGVAARARLLRFRQGQP